ncbi:universal stress protein family [Pseudonocardia sp. N23]|nr:universal stress protein family [Pseudonocardia sp. N23]
MQDVGRSIVVGVDGSESSLGAVRRAAAEARRRGSGPRLVDVLGWDPTPRVGSIVPDQHAFHESLVRLADRHLDAAVEVARVVAPDVGIDRANRDGCPGPVLADESTRAEMLVLGNRGHGGFVGLPAVPSR